MLQALFEATDGRNWTNNDGWPTEDRPRPGRPRSRITPEFEAEVVRRTLEEQPPRGTHWSTRLMAECMGIHHSQVRRIWKAHGLKPHRVRYFKLSTDPRFVEKAGPGSRWPPPPPNSLICLGHYTTVVI